MKKIVLSIIVALIAITANAQVYVGGTFGVGSDKVETEGTEVKNTTFKILPEVGYELNEDWSVGTVVGYEYNKSGDVKTNTFTIAPYARYFFLNSDVVRFADCSPQREYLWSGQRHHAATGVCSAHRRHHGDGKC